MASDYLDVNTHTPAPVYVTAPIHIQAPSPALMIIPHATHALPLSHQAVLAIWGKKSGRLPPRSKVREELRAAQEWTTRCHRRWHAAEILRCSRSTEMHPTLLRFLGSLPPWLIGSAKNIQCGKFLHSWIVVHFVECFHWGWDIEVRSSWFSSLYRSLGIFKDYLNTLSQSGEPWNLCWTDSQKDWACMQRCKIYMKFIPNLERTSQFTHQPRSDWEIAGTPMCSPSEVRHINSSTLASVRTLPPSRCRAGCGLRPSAKESNLGMSMSLCWENQINITLIVK